MKNFGNRPATANAAVRIRLNTANSYDPHIDPAKLAGIQVKEFGEKQAGETPNFSRPLTAVPKSASTVRPVVYSTISKTLKLELRKHVPMYNHSEMGRIFYRETESKIVRPNTATGIYKGLMKMPQVKDPALARPSLKPFENDSSEDPIGGTIRGRNPRADEKVNTDLSKYLQIKGITPNQEYHPAVVRKAPSSASATTSPHAYHSSTPLLPIHQSSFRKRRLFTVQDNQKRFDAEDASRQERKRRLKGELAYDSNFITLTNYNL